MLIRRLHSYALWIAIFVCLGVNFSSCADANVETVELGDQKLQAAPVEFRHQVILIASTVPNGFYPAAHFVIDYMPIALFEEPLIDGYVVIEPDFDIDPIGPGASFSQKDPSAKLVSLVYDDEPVPVSETVERDIKMSVSYLFESDLCAAGQIEHGDGKIAFVATYVTSQKVDTTKCYRTGLLAAFGVSKFDEDVSNYFIEDSREAFTLNKPKIIQTLKGIR